MVTLTRKTFLRGGISLTAAMALPSGLLARRIDDGTSSLPSAPAIKPNMSEVGVPEMQPVIRLYPEKAVSRSGDIRFGRGELSIMLPFFGAGEVLWAVNVPEAGRFQLGLCYSTTKPSVPVAISSGKHRIEFAAPLTRGYYFPHPDGPAEEPDPDDDSFWQMREYYMFERVPVPGEIELVRGVNVVKLNVAGEKGEEIFRLRSLELTPVAKQAAIEAEKARARMSRADTDWFADAGYGMWFHFLDLTTPRRGPRKPYEQAVNELDVGGLAKMVDDCGASYLIFTVNHGNPTCPAPIESWEKLHPGWTTKRDLIAELADALGRYNIKLMLYMNCPGIGHLIQQHGTAIDVPSFSEAEYADQLVSVFNEFGHRYGEKLVGYWFDSWFQTLESYPNLPNEALFWAMKAGFRDRLVSMNHWAFPTEVEWQDYWCGEISDLPAKPFGSRYMTHGAGVGLQAHSAISLDAPWFHIEEDKEMEPPRYSATQLADYVRTCQRDQAPVTLGVGIYQDGTIGPKSLAVLKELRGKIRGPGRRAG